MEDVILEILKVLCPYLKDMAKKTGSPIDDYIVSILCLAANAHKKEK